MTEPLPTAPADGPAEVPPADSGNEPLPPRPIAPTPPDLMNDPVEPSPELARKNLRLTIVLTVVFLVLFGGTFGIGYAYLWLS